MTVPHPDADLLNLCHRLREMQAEWQRLYDATSDEPRLTTAADHAWNDYSNHVWPGIKIASGIFTRSCIPATCRASFSASAPPLPRDRPRRRLSSRWNFRHPIF